MATQVAETPVLSLEDYNKVREEIKEVPRRDQTKRLREKYNKLTENVRRER